MLGGGRVRPQRDWNQIHSVDRFVAELHDVPHATAQDREQDVVDFGSMRPHAHGVDMPLDPEVRVVNPHRRPAEQAGPVHHLPELRDTRQAQVEAVPDRGEVELASGVQQALRLDHAESAGVGGRVQALHAEVTSVGHREAAVAGWHYRSVVDSAPCG